MDIALLYSIRLFLAFIFLRAAWHKLSAYQAFYTQLRAYRLLPAFFLPVFAMGLLLLELYCVFTLPVLAWQHPSAIGAGLLALYAFAIAVNLLRGRKTLDCGCGGPVTVSQPVHWALVVRNLLLMVIALAGSRPGALRTLETLDGVTIVCATLAMALVYCAIEQAMANWQRQSRYLNASALSSASNLA